MLELAIHEEADAARKRLQKQHPELEKELEKAYAFVLFPSVGRAGLVLGGAYGHGEVFEQGSPVGFATISQMTVGVQIGGQTFSEVVIFNKKESFEDFKLKGRVGFSANASAVILKAAASGTTNFADVVAHAYSSGGMLLEVSLGGSKMMFIPPLKQQDGHWKSPEQKQPSESTEEKEKKGPVSEVKDIVGGAIGREALEKLASHPILSRAISSLRFISPILPHKKGEQSALGKFANQLSAIQKEKKIGETLHKEVTAALETVREKHPNTGSRLDEAYGYAVFPKVGGASLVLGGATGLGEIFEQHKLAGYAQLVQVTIGVQLGGQTFTEILIFPDKANLNQFKEGKISFTANAAATIVKAGAMVTTKYDGAEIMAFTEGGLLAEAALGGQKFFYKQAFLTKGKSDEGGHGQKQAGKGEDGRKQSDTEGPSAQPENKRGEEKRDENQQKEEHKDNQEETKSRKIGRFNVKDVS